MLDSCIVFGLIALSVWFLITGFFVQGGERFWYKSLLAFIVGLTGAVWAWVKVLWKNTKYAVDNLHKKI